MWKPICSLLLLVAAARAERIESARPVMGSLARITVYAEDSTRASAAIEKGFARLAELERKLSDYDPNSELNQRPAHPSEDLRKVLAFADQLRIDSKGAFDQTAGAVFRMWREARRTRTLPTDAAIEVARRGPLQYDLGGIAKGFAAGEALAVLREQGFPRAMVALSGDLCLGDPPPDRGSWTIEIEPGIGRRKLSLTNVCVSTSGDREQALEIGGKRYSHIVDPRTGQALTSPIGVTVIARDGMTADSLATALSVTGMNEPLLKKYRAAGIVWTPKSTLETQLHLFERTRPVRAQQSR